MATTKFLDYTGLSKLVEKIKNTYVNKNEQYEANLKWGGKNFTGSYGPIDAALIPELGANRFAFGNPEGITVEYSNDGGNTWKDYGASNESKLRLTSIENADFIVGKAGSSTPENDMLRITFDTSCSTGICCYSVLNKFVIYISSNGMKDCYCTIQKATQKTPTAFLDVVIKVPIDGWSGYNIINTPEIRTYGNEVDQYGRIRFIFGGNANELHPDGRLSILNIFAFGGVGWNTPSNMAKNGRLYKYDHAQNATFPANVTATNFVGNLQGSASKLGTSTVGSSATPMYLNNGTPTPCNHSLNADVPSTAKFTDTTYTDLKGATTSANGTHGLVPAPTKSDVGKFLKGDGTWGTPTAPTLPTDAVENIIGGSTDSYSGFLDGDGLKIVMEAVKTLIGVVDIPYYSVEIMNFSGNVERVAIKMSNEFAQAQFFDNLYNLKFIKFGDGCVFTRIGQTLNQGNPVFKGTVVDQMQGIDDMVAWISTDGSNTYLIFDDANNTVASGALDDSYTPTPLETKLTWGN